ncbi:RmlC-like jelly roll fold [Fusarium oxysporum f. sp. vasinfectum]|nr:RmlC-like jelly roll fold [Fusarium oxysporum f. sp. vasinfectum]
MKLTTTFGVLASLLAIEASAQPTRPGQSLYVTETPNGLRPYVIAKNYGSNIQLANQVMRIPVSANSSAGTFTILQIAGPESATGDFGGVAHDTIHTFQMLDPDTMFTCVIQPGGFEALFFLGGPGSYDSPIGSAYLPAEAYDHWPMPDFVLRHDDINGIAGSGNWHNGSNEPAIDATTPFYIAKGWGPKYLNREGGVYKIIAPLQTEATSAGNLTMGTITMSPLQPGGRPSQAVFTEHTSLVMEEGQLVVTVNGETAKLIDGDVIFIPADTQFTYYASAAVTKFLYVNPGRDGLANQLIQNSIPWDYVTYPQYAP